MAQRTPEEILAQRDAWMARKAARAAGQDIPIIPPLRPGEEAPAVDAAATTETAEAPQPVAEVTPAAVTPIAVAETAPASQPAQPASNQGGPRRPEGGQRSAAEVLAQREAWMARKAAKAAGAAPPPAPKLETVAAPAAAPAAPKPVTPAAAPKAAAPAPAKREEPKPEPIDPNITRRELLNYAWLASIGLFTAETVGLSLWFAFPNFKPGSFGGTFSLGVASEVLREVNSPPAPYTDGKFWLVNLDMEGPGGEPRKGVLAIFKVCTHLGCLYEWVDIKSRFECPCHGSRFALTGDYLAGPARRSLDRFVIQAQDAAGNIRAQTNENGDPLEVQPDDILVIDTGSKILGSSEIIPA